MTPHYTIKDWDAAQPIMQQIIDRANQEPGCTYFGWEKSGNMLNSRETFTDENAMRAHIENVKPLLDQLKSGPAKEIKKIKDAAASLDPEYFESSTKQIKDTQGPVESSAAGTPAIGAAGVAT